MIIKICGMREPENIREIEHLGVQWMGFIFYPSSPRYVNKRPTYLPKSAQRVGVFVNDTIYNIVQHTLDFGLNAIQLHGKETPEFCKNLLERYHAIGTEITLIKAFPITKERDLEETIFYEPYCQYFLFDTPCPNYGGSGQTFNWNILSAYRGKTPFLLSGGISFHHLPVLKQFKHPYWIGIDLNSGFEIIPAYKDVSLLQKFILQIKK